MNGSDAVDFFVNVLVSSLILLMIVILWSFIIIVASGAWKELKKAKNKIKETDDQSGRSS